MFLCRYDSSSNVVGVRGVDGVEILRVPAVYTGHVRNELNINGDTD